MGFTKTLSANPVHQKLVEGLFNGLTLSSASSLPPFGAFGTCPKDEGVLQPRKLRMASNAGRLWHLVPASAPKMAVAKKSEFQNGTLVSGNMDQTCVTPV